jgi:hypothetical protein
MAALTARATGIPRIYQMQRNARPGSFVREKLAQLVESPGMPLIAMFVANRYPLSDSTQVLKSDCLARYGGFLHQGLRDTVIHIYLKATLPACILAQTALRIPRIDLLQALAASMVAGACLFDGSAAKRFAIAIGRQIHDAQVYAERAAIRFGFWRRFATLRHVQIVDTTSPDEIGPTNLPHWVNQHLMLTGAKQQTTDDTAFQRIERYPVEAHQAIGTCIVADATTRTEAWAGVTALGIHRFESFHGLRSGTDRQLCAQAIVQARFTIDPMVGGVGVGDALIPAYLRNPGCGLIEGALRCR